MTSIGAFPPSAPLRPSPGVVSVLAGAPRATAEAEDGAKSPAARLAPNPLLRVDPTLNIVVLEFRDATGEVRQTMPTERELSSYRAALRRGDEGAPAGGVSPPPSVPAGSGAGVAPGTAPTPGRASPAPAAAAPAPTSADAPAQPAGPSGGALRASG